MKINFQMIENVIMFLQITYIHHHVVKKKCPKLSPPSLYALPYKYMQLETQFQNNSKYLPIHMRFLIWIVPKDVNMYICKINLQDPMTT